MFKMVICVKGNGLAEKGKTYWYKVSKDKKLDMNTWKYVETGKKVYHIYVAENTDAWIFNLHDENEFREMFKEV